MSKSIGANTEVRGTLEVRMEGGSIVVGNDCLIEGYVVCENKTSQIYIGVSVVTHDVPAWHVVAGNPARVIRKIEECER